MSTGKPFPNLHQGWEGEFGSRLVNDDHCQHFVRFIDGLSLGPASRAWRGDSFDDGLSMCLGKCGKASDGSERFSRFAVLGCLSDATDIAMIAMIAMITGITGP